MPSYFVPPTHKQIYISVPPFPLPHSAFPLLPSLLPPSPFPPFLLSRLRYECGPGDIHGDEITRIMLFKSPGTLVLGISDDALGRMALLNAGALGVFGEFTGDQR